MRKSDLNEFYRNKKIKFCHQKTEKEFVIVFDDETELTLKADVHSWYNNSASPCLRIFIKDEVKELL